MGGSIMGTTNEHASSMKQNSENQANPLPSDFMRSLHPDYFSDSSHETVYELDQATLEYHLESLTHRNQMHDFEIFCRKLCERAICPNLRPATGPEGGGDSKADSETHVVAEEIAQLTYEGEPNARSERWAFAFSTKKRWIEKVRSDVSGLVRTGRNYDQIILVTSQFAPAKKRAELEDSLTRQHSVPIVIHDRSWITKEIIENGRRDLAFNYLHVGRELSDRRSLGPGDYSRSRQLKDIEAALAIPDTFQGMETQRVTEALVATKLSRNLELPRVATEGRFERAKRLADNEGTRRQRLEVRFEALLTAFWWYNDFKLLNSSYDEFEAMLSPDEHVRNVEFLGTLALLLANCVIHGYLTIHDSKLIERTTRLRKRLEIIERDLRLPNSALEATTLLLLLKLHMFRVLSKTDQISEIWQGFSEVLERAKSLGEFRAERLVEFIGISGNFAGDDSVYDELVEKAAEFIGKRQSEVAGARLLVRRANQIESDKHFEIIRLLGKASLRLSKKEYADELAECLPLLALSYRSAGLLWAARSTCYTVTTLLIIESEEESEISPKMISITIILAWILLELRHIPDLLCCVELLKKLALLPLTDESREILREKFSEIDLALASHFLNYTGEDLRQLEALPDTLGRLHLIYARCALLYSLGYEEECRESAIIPMEGTPGAVSNFFAALKHQPVSEYLREPMICNFEAGQTLVTTVLGLRISAEASGSAISLLVAEAIVGTTEAFFATAIDLKVMPHTETFHIRIVEDDRASEPEFQMYRSGSRADFVWPTGKDPAELEFQPIAIRCFMGIVASILGSTCHIPDIEDLVTQLHQNEVVGDRMTMIVGSLNTYSRAMGQNISRVSDHINSNDRRFSPRDTSEAKGLRDPFSQRGADLDEDSSRMSHRNMAVKSIIDVHLWDRAKWRGTAFFDFGPKVPPVFALMFEDRETAEEIFNRWRERIGTQDTDEVIYIAIIRGVSSANSSHYEVLVTSRQTDDGARARGGLVVHIGRHTTVMPNTSTNLDRFLDEYERKGAYLLGAAVLDGSKAEPVVDRVILKRRLVVRSYDEIGPDDVEVMAFPELARDRSGDSATK